MRRLVGPFLVLAAVAACSSSPTPTAPTATTVPPSAANPAATAAGDLVPVPGGFDFARVRLMDAADLPAGIPVPVPFGGTIDDTVSASEGQSLIIEYDPRFLLTAAAFYQTWIQQEGIDARVRNRYSGEGVSWDAVVGGQDVRIELSLEDDGSASKLIVLWP